MIFDLLDSPGALWSVLNAGHRIIEKAQKSMEIAQKLVER